MGPKPTPKPATKKAEKKKTGTRTRSQRAPLTDITDSATVNALADATNARIAQLEAQLQASEAQNASLLTQDITRGRDASLGAVASVEASTRSDIAHARDASLGAVVPASFSNPAVASAEVPGPAAPVASLVAVGTIASAAPNTASQAHQTPPVNVVSASFPAPAVASVNGQERSKKSRDLPSHPSGLPATPGHANPDAEQGSLPGPSATDVELEALKAELRAFQAERLTLLSALKAGNGGTNNPSDLPAAVAASSDSGVGAKSTSAPAPSTAPADEEPTIIDFSRPKSGGERIPRPPAGSNIREAMGMKNQPGLYHAIQRGIKDGIIGSDINWELPWAEIPPRDKARLYSAVRQDVPEMKRYVNDWATEAIAKQYMKNRRAHSYRRGYLAPPSKYAYLKENAAKRTDAPRGNGKKRVHENASAGPSRARASAKIGPPRKKAKVASSAKEVVGKGKGKAIPEDDDDEEDDSDDEEEA